jgi:hypothetical protein
VGGEFERHGLGETQHRELARHVVREKGDPTLLSGHRHRIDNATGRSQSDHRASRRLPAIEDAVGIDLEVTHEVGLLIYGDVLWVVMMQELVPRDVLGRVSSLVYLLAFSLGPIGILLGGVAAATIGIRETLVLSGLVSGLICVLVLFIPGVRDPDRRDVESELSDPDSPV